jgi:hypothetical protein
LVARRPRGWTALAGLTLAVGCSGSPDGAPPDPTAVALARLRTFEATRRAEVDFRAWPGDEVLGPDPVAVAAIPESGLFAGVLRGRSAIVLLDAEARELDRLAAPAAASALAVGESGEVLAGGELADELALYAVVGGRLQRTGSLPLPGVRSVRALALGPERIVYVVEDHDHRLLTLSLDANGGVLDAFQLCLGPRTVQRTARHLVVGCLLSHEVCVLGLDARGVPRRDDLVRIVHDGPVWAVDARETGDALLVALGGVEDHPLDRRQGSFGYIDSFAWVYRVGGNPAAAGRLAAADVSALGVVTPKVVRLATEGDAVRVRVVGYGDATVADLLWAPPRRTRKGLWQHPETRTRALVPGAAAAAAVAPGSALLADPLLDAWIVDDGVRARVVPVPDGGRGSERSFESRVGEALFFTTLMAPWNRTKGSLSRFTCETCHFEGYVDGRVHHTGRDDVRVTTKPLLGLFNNAPHFSRALDPDLTAVAHNEFRVAGLRSRHEPWFSLGVEDAPWLAHLGVGSERLSPEALRRALMVFLMEFAPRPNPAAVGRTAWSPEERRGAEVFRDACEGCHEARLAADRANSRLPLVAWEPLVLTRRGPIVWARDTYERTGVVPYPHERGTRVPSLRRLYKKRPYFTNGSAFDLGEIVRRARLREGAFLHAGAGVDAVPDEGDRRALVAFLDLL